MIAPRSATSLVSPSVRIRMSAPSGADVDPLDQQLDDPRLLGREQLIPKRIEPLQRLAHIGFAETIDQSISALRATCGR